MDDATTAFATACAVIAASTGMVLCFSPKNQTVDDVVVTDEKEMMQDQQPVNIEETKVIIDPIDEPSMPTPSDDVTVEVTNEDKSMESDANVTSTAISSPEDAVPEQRPESPAVTVADGKKVEEVTTTKKRRFTLRSGTNTDRSHRIYESTPTTTNELNRINKKPMFKRAQSMKLFFRKKNTNATSEIIAEV